MLQITVNIPERYDELSDEFLAGKSQVLKLEHSLVSLSKWESKWHKPFLSANGLTNEETIDYIRFMTTTQNVDPATYDYLSRENIEAINTYIEDPMTATTFSKEEKGKIGREIVTAELIYYWMIALTIPFECQKWHLNRLITLIKVCNIKNAPPKKLSRGDILRQNAELNAKRKKQLNTKG